MLHLYSNFLAGILYRGNMHLSQTRGADRPSLELGEVVFQRLASVFPDHLFYAAVS